MYVFKEPSEIKLIILYIIQNFAEPIDNGQITDIFMDYEFVDYFTMQQYLDELVGTNLVDKVIENGMRLYFLTKHGTEAYTAYIHKIPVSVREKLLLTIKNYRKMEKAGDDVKASYQAINELSYAADLSIREAGFPLLDIKMSVGTKDTARAVCEKFKNDPQKIYTAILKLLLPEEEY